MKEELLERYKNDAVFHHLTSVLVKAMRDKLIDEPGIRDAVDVAMYIKRQHEMDEVHRFLMSQRPPKEKEQID